MCSRAPATDASSLVGLSKRHRLPKFLSTSVRTLSVRAHTCTVQFPGSTDAARRANAGYVGRQGLELSAPVFRANMRSAVGPVRHLTRDQHSLLDEARWTLSLRYKQYRLPWTRPAPVKSSRSGYFYMDMEYVSVNFCFKDLSL